MLHESAPRRLARSIVALAVALCLMAVSHRAQAQGQDQDRQVDTISFNEAVRIALDQNTTLKRESNAVRRSEIAVSRARMDFFPSISLSSGGQRSFGRSFSQEAGGIVNETSDFFRLGANTSVNLFNGFGDIAELRRAGLQAQASDLGLERTRQDVVFTVMERYLAVIESQELIHVQQEELEARRQQLRQVEEEVEVGAKPTSDLYQQQVQVAEAEQLLLDAEQQAQLDETRLIQTLQLDPFGEYEFEAPDIEENDFMPEDYNLDTLLQQAFQRRTDLRAREFEVQAAEKNVRVARSGYYPRIDLSANYGSNWSSTAPPLPVPGTGSDPQVVEIPTTNGSSVPYQVPGTGSPGDIVQPTFFDQLDNRRNGSVSLSLSFPIFDRMQTKHLVEQAKVDLSNARYDLQDRRQQIALQVRQAYLDYQNAEKQLDVAETRLRAAERAREAAQERYNLGAAPFVELAEANASYVDAASQQVQARYTLIFRQKLIDYYLGVLDPREPLLR